MSTKSAQCWEPVDAYTQGLLLVQKGLLCHLDLTAEAFSACSPWRDSWDLTKINSSSFHQDNSRVTTMPAVVVEVVTTAIPLLILINCFRGTRLASHVPSLKALLLMFLVLLHS